MQHYINHPQIQPLFLLDRSDQELCHGQAHILLQEKWKNPTLARLAEVAPVSPGRRPSPAAPLSSREQALHRHAESGHALRWLHKYTTMTGQARNVLVLLPMYKTTHLVKIQCWAARDPCSTHSYRPNAWMLTLIQVNFQQLPLTAQGMRIACSTRPCAFGAQGGALIEAPHWCQCARCASACMQSRADAASWGGGAPWA